MTIYRGLLSKVMVPSMSNCTQGVIAVHIPSEPTVLGECMTVPAAMVYELTAIIEMVFH